MKHPFTRSTAPAVEPGSSGARLSWRSSALPRPHRPPVRTLFASGLALWLCVLATFVLALPGFALGTEGSPPQSTAGEATFLQKSSAEPGTTTAGSGEATPPADASSRPTPMSSADSTGTVLARRLGRRLGQVGLLKPGEGLSRGPEAIAVASDGRIAILDSVNRRLVLLDATGAFTHNVPVSLGEPRFLAVYRRPHVRSRLRSRPTSGGPGLDWGRTRPLRPFRIWTTWSRDCSPPSAVRAWRSPTIRSAGPMRTTGLPR